MLAFVVVVLSFLALGDSFAIRPIVARTWATSLRAVEPVTFFEQLSVESGRNIVVRDITKEVAEVVRKSGCDEGVVTIFSKHSTVGVGVNEMEGRFVDDLRQFLLKTAPPYYPWLHNDIDNRVGPDDWPGGDEAWRDFRATQPVNAHSHIIAMLIGNSEAVPISKSVMQIGKYQNIMVVDADGQKGKMRTILVQVTGTKGSAASS